jgi:hypothetical protein
VKTTKRYHWPALTAILSLLTFNGCYTNYGLMDNHSIYVFNPPPPPGPPIWDPIPIPPPPPSPPPLPPSPPRPTRPVADNPAEPIQQSPAPDQHRPTGIRRLSDSDRPIVQKPGSESRGPSRTPSPPAPIAPTPNPDAKNRQGSSIRGGR